MLGILAEDGTDVETLKVLARRIINAPVGQQPKFKTWSGNGCARLREKAGSWFKDVLSSGCTRAVLVHDLDRNPANGALNDEAKLRSDLEAIPVPEGLSRLICIPVEEIEAWFFADPGVLKKYDAENKATPSPHNVKGPKEELTRLSRTKNKRPRYSTNENPALATLLDLDLCAKRCASFKSFREFVKNGA